MHGCFKIGVKQAETGPMLETNEKVQTQWQDFPLEQHKRRRCFVKVLTPRTAGVCRCSHRPCRSGRVIASSKHNSAPPS